MPLGDADIAAGVFFADFGHAVTFGGQTVNGLFDAPGKDAMFDKSSVSDAEYFLTLASGAFSTMPSPKSRLSVDAALYQVISSTPLDDGLLIEYKLRRLG